MKRPWRLEHGLVLLFEDDDLLVVDKPAGLLSVAKTGGREESVYRVLARYLQKKGEKRLPAVVHRLDRDTSGVMVLVKSAALKKAFMENWREAVVKREYAARVEGILAAEAGVIDVPLKENREGRVFAAKKGEPGSKEAMTAWFRTGRGSSWTAVKVQPETGRHNQIRFHFAHIGHPVLGDRKYGFPSEDREKNRRKSRLFLHAETLSFHHPRGGQVLEFRSPVPWDPPPNALRKKEQP